MTKVSTICKRCEFYQRERNRHMCWASLENNIDYVTGKRYVGGAVACRSRNTNGDCPFYQEKIK